MYMMGQKRKQTCFVDLKRMEKAIVNNRKRIKEIDRLIARICEDNVNGKLSDERSIRAAITKRSAPRGAVFCRS